MASRETISKLSEAAVTLTKQKVIMSDYEIPQRIPCHAPNFNRHIPILKFALTLTKERTENSLVVMPSVEVGSAEILKGIPDGEGKDGGAIAFWPRRLIATERN